MLPFDNSNVARKNGLYFYDILNYFQIVGQELDYLLIFRL